MVVKKKHIGNNHDDIGNGYGMVINDYL